jgi:BirA family biotin operon repressor/biotin-[acetyl-CoA-carboxylase] ligase
MVQGRSMKRLVIRNPWPGACVYFKKRTASTMEEARRLFDSDCPDGTVVLTDFQTLGRGRIAERRWIAEAGKNLLFTLVLRSESGREGIGAAPQRLPLIAGLALALSVEHLYGLSVQLKWPNDLLAGKKKLAGILCEALVQGDSLGVLVGIGLNCNQKTFPRELESKATSLALELGGQVSLPDLLEEVLRKLKTSLGDQDWHAKVVDRLYGLKRGYGRRKTAPPANEASQARSAGYGQPVNDRPMAVLLFPADRGVPPQQGSEQWGVVLGLNPDGSLLFQPEKGDPVSVYGGEIRFIDDPQL